LETRPLDRRALWTIRGAWSVLISTPLLLPYTLWNEYTDELHFTGFFVDTIAPGAFENVFILFGPLLYIVVYLLYLVAFFMWTYRAASNARIMTPAGADISPDWAIGWYLIPIMSLWKPYQALRRVWACSLSPSAMNEADIPTSFVWFWILSASSALLLGPDIRIRYEFDAAEDYSVRAAFDLLVLALEAALAVATIAVVRGVTNAQNTAGSAYVFE